MGRLFTIATPHRGASLAFLGGGGQLSADMEPGSMFLLRLNDPRNRRDYDLHPYVRLGDMIVGAENTAPPGQRVWWVANAPFQSAHLGAFTDARILADVARRLRDEPPYTTAPPQPLP